MPQVEGLQELVSEPSDPQQPESNASSSSQAPAQPLENFSNLVAGSRLGTANSFYPSPTQAKALVETFVSNVDPVIKVLHIPTLRKEVDSQFSAQTVTRKTNHMNLLLAAVFFASVTSMTESECQTHLQLSKQTAVSGFRYAFEDGLARSHFMSRADMVTLQALVIFIVRLCIAHLTVEPDLGHT
jgi:hypothetical protein